MLGRFGFDSKSNFPNTHDGVGLDECKLQLVKAKASRGDTLGVVTDLGHQEELWTFHETSVIIRTTVLSEDQHMYKEQADRVFTSLSNDLQNKMGQDSNQT